MMFEAIILGLVQGFTEFLPVSSTAHLVLIPWFFKWDGLVNSLTFDVALHIGTLFAVLVCFYQDLIDMLGKKKRLLFLVIVGIIPAGAAGVLLKHMIESLRTPYIISAMLVAFGIVMWLAERVGSKRQRLADMGFFGALFVGIAQAIALIPGVSRSGISISAGLFAGYKREDATRFSFLISIPVIAGAALLEARKVFTSSENIDMTLIAVGIASSALSGIVAIKFMLKYLKNHTMNVFVIYRFILAGLIMGWVWLGG